MRPRSVALGGLLAALVGGCSVPGPPDGPPTPPPASQSGSPTVSGNFPTWYPSPTTQRREPEEIARAYGELFADARVAAEKVLGRPTRWRGMEDIVHVERTFLGHDGDGMCIVALRDSSVEGLDAKDLDADLLLSSFNAVLTSHGFPAAPELVTNPGGQLAVVSDMPGDGPRFTVTKGWMIGLELRIPASPLQCEKAPGR